MEARTILVCVADHQWTLEALHLACSLALDTGNLIELVSFVAVGHPLYLGASYAHWGYGVREYELVEGYTTTLKAYGVGYAYRICQYVTLADAIVDAAEQLDAEIVFATLPATHFQLWRRFRIWTMRRGLAKRRSTLYTLDHPLETLVWAPGRIRHSDAVKKHEHEHEHEF